MNGRTIIVAALGHLRHLRMIALSGDVADSSTREWKLVRGCPPLADRRDPDRPHAVILPALSDDLNATLDHLPTHDPD
jgi:hypothetical protein